MAGDVRHVLQMAFAPFVADRAVMRVVEHQPFNDALAERCRVRMLDGDPGALGGGGHTGHHQPTGSVLFVAKLHDGALTAGSHGAHRRVPTEIRQVKAFR